jgi:hypothetical protein
MRAIRSKLARVRLARLEVCAWKKKRINSSNLLSHGYIYVLLLFSPVIFEGSKKTMESDRSEDQVDRKKSGIVVLYYF